MPDQGPGWQLVGFEERFDAWVALESPGDDLRLIVLAWVLSRIDDPYAGVSRERGFANLWFEAIPSTRHPDDLIVCCSYWLEESAHSVRCDSFATLHLPL